LFYQQCDGIIPAKQTQKIQTAFVESHANEIFEAAIKGMAIFPKKRRVNYERKAGKEV
jgi:hypothetical protein